MELIEPTMQYEESWKEVIAELDAEGRVGFWNYPEKPTDLESYIQRCRDFAQGKNLPTLHLPTHQYVPSSTFWLIDNGTFIGHTNIRHRLNENLLKVGGHIGYAIRVSARGRGYGTKILEFALPKAKALGIQRALLTCDESNVASRKIIEKNGGVYENSVAGENGPKRRYWIDLR